MSGYLGLDRVRLSGGDRGLGGDRGERPILAVTGDGGFGQYMAELLTAVKHKMNITHVLINNGQLGKISRSSAPATGTCGRRSSTTPTSPSTRASAGPWDQGHRRRAARRGDAAALAHDGPAMVEVVADADLV